MLSRLRLQTTWKAAAAVTLLLFSFTGCQHPKTTSKTTAETGHTNSPPRVRYSKTYDVEIKERCV